MKPLLKLLAKFRIQGIFKKVAFCSLPIDSIFFFFSHPIYKLVQNKGLHQPSKRSYNSLTMPRIQKKSRSNSKRSTASFTTKTTSVIATPALASPTPIICEAPNTSMDIPQTPCLLQKPQTTRVTRQLSSSLNQEMCPNILTKNVQTDATCPVCFIESQHMCYAKIYCICRNLEEFQKHVCAQRRLDKRSDDTQLISN
jgi:hypothetical protein